MKLKGEKVTVELKNGTVIEGTIIGKQNTHSPTPRRRHPNEHPSEKRQDDRQAKEPSQPGAAHDPRQQRPIRDPAAIRAAGHLSGR